jgi:hypothetical protein
MRQRLLAEGEGSPLGELSTLAIDALFATPVSKLTSAQKLADWWHGALKGWADSPDAAKALEKVVEALVNALNADPRTLREGTPRALQVATEELAGRPFAPDKKLVMKLIDHKPLRDPIRQMVIATVTDFTARAPGASVAKGVTGIARFAASQVRARTGGLGALVGAVGDEVQGQLEKRAKDFADAALAGVLAEIADIISNPARAQEAADIRVAVVRAAQDLTFPQLGRELVNLEVASGAELLRGHVKQWVASEDSKKHLLEGAEELFAPFATRTVGEIVREWGQEASLRAHYTPWFEERFRDVVKSDGFGPWLDKLLDTSKPDPFA